MEQTDSNLVAHARTELELLGEDEPMRTHLLGLVELFAAGGHSGSSAEYAIERLGQLLRYEHLTPLTDDPSEWEDRSEISGYPIWQSNRNPKVFSNDGGKTWWFLGAEAGAV